MKHALKIERKYLDRIHSGEKTFEVRRNDRDFQVGDHIVFTTKEPCGVTGKVMMFTDLNVYEITYILGAFFAAINPEHVVFSIKEVPE